MTYESWRITFQSGEQAARSAYADVERLTRENAELREKLERVEADRVAVINYITHTWEMIESAPPYTTLCVIYNELMRLLYPVDQEKPT